MSFFNTNCGYINATKMKVIVILMIMICFTKAPSIVVAASRPLEGDLLLMKQLMNPELATSSDPPRRPVRMLFKAPTPASERNRGTYIPTPGSHNRNIN